MFKTLTLNMPEAEEGTRVQDKKDCSQKPLLQRRRKKSVQYGNYKNLLKNPLELSLSSFYNGLVINTVIDLKLNQQGQLF